jgi:hypothetical protein
MPIGPVRAEGVTCVGELETARGTQNISWRETADRITKSGQEPDYGPKSVLVCGPKHLYSRSLTYINLSCPLEVVVTAETVSHYKEDHFQLEALRSDRMD